MFGPSKPKYQRLTTNLRLSINRLKLLEKKKTELAVKARCEISEYLIKHKEDRARIRVEHIVREDYLVEAMEIVEMFCDLLLARMGLIQATKELDASLEESIATIIWITPRLMADVPELKIVAEQLTLKYSKEYAMQCLSNVNNKVNSKVIQKLSVTAPPKILIDKYLLAIASTYNVDFEIKPDEVEDASDVMQSETLIDFDLPGIPPMQQSKAQGEKGQGLPGPDFSNQAGPDGTPFNPKGPGVPPFNPGAGGNCGVLAAPNVGFNVPPPAGVKGPPPAMPSHPPAPGFNLLDQLPTIPRDASPSPSFPQNTNISMPPAYSDELNLPDIPTDLSDLPSIPNNNQGPSNTGGSSADIDDEDIMRRFNALKNHK